MAKVRKAYPEDFDKVYELFLGFNNPNLTKEDYRHVFSRRWSNEEEHCGYALEEGDDLVGFIGTLFSRRMIGGIEHKFCNLTRWIVREEFRNESLFMLFPILKMRDYTITDFTPSKDVQQILLKFGFQVMEEDYIKILPAKTCAAERECLITFDEEKIRENLSGAGLRLFEDHEGMSCTQFLIVSEGESCHVIAKRVLRKELPFAHVHYVGNRKLFLSCLPQIRMQVARKMKAITLLADARFFIEEKPEKRVKFPFNQVHLFKSEHLKREEIDNLYSELVLLPDF